MSSVLSKIGLIAAFVAIGFSGMAQKGKVKAFFKLSGPEKRWVMTHPFIAIKTLKLSERAKEITKLQGDSPLLDGYTNGGQVDAFRHCFWMASLSRHIKETKALKLGIAHEEGNERDFRKRQNEEGVLPDAIANTMDLWNNQVGVVLNRENPNSSEEMLIALVNEAIGIGRCRIIKRNANGDFLDVEGKVIKHEDWHGKWVNSRCLVPSDQAVH